MSMEIEVAVVGAGPVGLMLAAELALAGVRVRVFERRARRTEQSRALTLHPRSLELLDQRGIVDRFVRRGAPIPSAHFAVLDTRLDFSRLPTPHPYTLFLPQVHTEELLEARARELGVEIAREHALVDLAQTDDAVALRVQGPGGELEVRARYAVGCDGAGSAVRRAVGVDFPGSATTRTAILGDVVLADPPARPVSRTNAHGLLLLVPLGDGAHRIVVIDPTRAQVPLAEPVTLDELRGSVTRIFGADLGMHAPRWLSRFGDATRLAERYRVGRVFLAGDAAHMHFPAGGQGLNVGLQDATNLGWKLAAAVRGWAPPWLLDSYHDERRPVGEALARNTTAQGKLMDVSPEGLALRELFDELLAFPAVQRKLAGLISAIDVAYPDAAGTHPLVGRRVPDLDLATERGPQRLYPSLHAGRFVLLGRAGDLELREAWAPWRDRVELVAATFAADPDELEGVTRLLLRPDGHVAWAGDDASSLGAVLPRWCGPAATRGPLPPSFE
ncbi:2-polyprenyl-6-methoxyphenol hydroxylase [Nannocystis exedens]|uniref:2-polyprenyl-6-methoxyphenol hydroxylase n=2 Tax=Nannocystis exedens TaxID=54 RepID=A0A1I2CT30_9BACT|nr:FAD-dependent monooxygenase [Nannocystis exedens]PCC68535.1 monooxygenase [Nannocystis exedens]SFE71394.1 2-polyprenyl-6-methoxyphenol hydroxylase [Nannocystis exedens]